MGKHLNIEAITHNTSVLSWCQSYLGCRKKNSVAADSGSANCCGVRLAWGRQRERLHAICHDVDGEDEDG